MGTENKQYFPLSILQKSLSGLILALIFGVCLKCVCDGDIFLGIIVEILIPIPILWSIAILPRYTAITDKEIIVKQVWGQLVFDYKKVEITSISKEKLRKSIRTFGNGGLFGYGGSFYNYELGHYRMYVTQMKDLAIITDTRGKKTVINIRMAALDNKSLLINEK